MANWTEASGATNGVYSNGSQAVFQGTPGKVTVDTANGEVSASGMTFATSGYTISGGAIKLIGTETDPGKSIVQVGDGTVTANGAIATINNVLTGDTMLVKTDLGKLVLAGNNTYIGGTAINAGVLEVVSGASLGTGGVTVGLSGTTTSAASTLQIDHGVSASNFIIVQDGGILLNAGDLGANENTAVAGLGTTSNGPRILNYDGGFIHGTHAGVSTVSYSSLVGNSTGGVIEGGDVAVNLTSGGQVSNDGAGSRLTSQLGSAVIVENKPGTVQNTGGGTIGSGGTALDFRNGGNVLNDGSGSSISSANGVAISVLGNLATVNNTNGATISGATTALYLEHGGTVVNTTGSTIKTSAASTGSCSSGAGHCAIFVSSSDSVPGSGNGNLSLTNSGSIIGDVQLVTSANNAVTLLPGSSVRGDLNIGSSSRSTLMLAGDPSSMQAYSQAVTGETTFAGILSATGAGTWVIDNDDLEPAFINVSAGTLQIGSGGTQGSVGKTALVSISGGRLVFDRSDDVSFNGGISGGALAANEGDLVQAGTGMLTLTGREIDPKRVVIERGTLRIGDLGDAASGSYHIMVRLPTTVNNGALVFDHSNVVLAGAISGTGSVTQNGSSSLVLQGENTYSGGTAVNSGTLETLFALPGDVMVGRSSILRGSLSYAPNSGLPGVAGNLSNAGTVAVRGGDSIIGGNYTQSSTGTLAVGLGSKLSVAGSAVIAGGTLEITGADIGYVSNSHTNVLAAAGGLTGTFDHLVKDGGLVFTSTSIQYDANHAWLDTTGLNVTTAAAGNGVTYTPASLGSAQRVQGVFAQLDNNLAATGTPAAPSEFMQAAGQFQQAPTLQAAQASLQSLSGQLHAASAAMTFEAIDASSRALADHFDDLLGKNAVYGTWMHNLSVGGDMGRAGYDGVGFQLNGWLVGNDMKIGSSGVAGFAFGQGRGQQQLDQSYDHNRSRSTEAMFYAGWLNGNWYTQGRFGVGHFQQDVSRRLLLGSSAQGVSTNYAGNYNVSYGESGLHLDWAGTRVSPFISAEYASIDRGAFAEEGAGGFGLRAGAQTLDRTQAGLGMRAAHHWTFDGGRTIDFNASAQFQRTLASRGDVFDASFVGMQQWQPLTGIGLSRYRALLNVGINAALSERTSVNLGYDYQKGQRDEAQMMSARWVMAL